VNGEPVFDNENKIIKWVVAFTDVHTEKSFSQELEKQVKERTNELLISNELMLQKNDLLRISENFNRSLTEISPNMVYIHDILDNKPFFLNSTFLNFTNYNWQQVKKLKENFMSTVIHLDDYQNIQEIIDKIKVSKVGEIFEAKCQIKNGQGVWIPFLNRLTAFKRDNQHKVTQIIGVAIDISELKSAEKILEQKNEELLKMNKELESFAYVSSHDLQEPLRKIQTFSSRIMEKEYENLSENGKNYLNRMRLAAERMQQLINDLLAYSRTKVQERKFENTDLKIIIEEVEEDLKDDLNKKGGQIEINTSCHANIIPFQFRQLIYNLISNSIKFAKSTEKLCIKVDFNMVKGAEINNDRLIAESDYCHISIADNGIGFNSDYKEKIFEIFQRLHGREEYSGTGIGLAIVKKIVDNHNGIITAEGELNVGATFNIYLPLNPLN
jgi:PAS domain S-box-containing protein